MSQYRTVRRIGQGGFGVVDEVENARGERFARKTFQPATGIPQEEHEGLKRRFKREVRVQAELGGTEILPVLKYDLDADKPWFVMPLAERIYDEEIANNLKQGSVNVDAIADILNGLQRLHDLGYVHRDLNPKNILLHEGHWKLSDLGAIRPPSGQTVTLTEDTIIYTEQYCSPEQRNRFHDAEPPADIYAFGCILHDLFGSPSRTPYAQQTASGDMGIIIEKCTEQNPQRRPSVTVLRDLVLEALRDLGGLCTVVDEESEKWLKRLEDIASWTDDDYGNFARFFAQLNAEERSPDAIGTWVHSDSMPFLTRLPADALSKIVARADGLAGAIVEKYSYWVRATAFAFHFADSICGRLAAIFDAGTPNNKAHALIALIELGESHNRWYVMREMLRRCGRDAVSRDIARRLQIEIRAEEVERAFRRCVQEVAWDTGELASEIAKLCE